MSATPSHPHHEPAPARIAPALVGLLATACGVLVANVYYAQPLVGPISAALGLSTEAAGLIVTMTQLGYVVGLLFLVPLGDLVENRRLMTAVMTVCAASLVMAAVARQPILFLAAMMAIGVSSVVVQMLIPFSAHLAPEAARGRVVGTVTSGLMIGIMMSRPVSSFVTHETSWPVIFAASALATAALALVLARRLPRRQPSAGLRYGALLASMLQIALHNRILQRRAAYQFCLYFAFSQFWTTVPLLLADAPFHFSQAGIAWFGLAAVAGAVAAPLGGTLADKGHARLATGIGIGSAVAALVLTLVRPASEPLHLALLTFAAMLLDFGVSFTVVTSQRTIFSLSAAMRSRLNGVFMASFFTGGALGSALGAWAYARAGWTGAAGLAVAFPVLGLALFATEFRRR
jgi:predicted MFS family arabinose efflux permease